MADPITPEEKEKFEGKPYHVLADHHVALVNAGKHDEAAEFHKKWIVPFNKKK